MDIEMLREFVVLADCLNFHTAAERLFITQPALSRHLASLEQDLGAPLFVRTTKHVEITKMGKVLLPDATSIVNQYEAMLARVRMERHVGTLRLGGFIRHEQVLPLLAAAINRFQRKYPWIHTCEEDLAAQDYKQWLLDDAFDVMLSPHLEQPDDNRFEYHNLLRIPLRVWMTAGNCFAGRPNISLNELQTQTLRFLSMGEHEQWGMWQAFILQLFTSQKLKPKVGPPTNVSLALSDTEYALVPSAVTKAYGDSIVSVSLDTSHDIDLSIIWKKSSSNPAVPLFVAEVLDVHGELIAGTSVGPG